MFGLTFEKLLIIGVIAVFLLGPDKLPMYAQKLGQFVRSMRDMANGAKSRMREEMGPEFDEVDWRKLDPRQYDPRRIVRDALNDVDPFATQAPSPKQQAATAAVTAAGAGTAAVGAGAAAVGSASSPFKRGRDVVRTGDAAPFDSEAT
ncbi:twin-arginine translocase TatA/TatE family subunit [Agromyces sp. SYSU T00194]|uniref:twin-arginine translocase TatA/TatE family subunit n=1 Tax=Agromyces chitinivorans TaxID=3158560 RepID=UPI003394B8EC